MAQNITEIKQRLDLYSNAAVVTMLRGRGVKSKSTRKAEMIAVLARAIKNRQGTEVIFDALGEPAQTLLHLLNEQGGLTSIGALERAASAAQITDFDAHFDQLLRKALVIYVSPHRVRHEMWRDVASGFTRDENLKWEVEGVTRALELAKDCGPLASPARALKVYDAEPFSIEESRPATLLHVVWSVVRWASEREVTLTKTSGTIRKADLKALDNQLKEQADLKGFALALALQTGLLRRQRDQILAHAEAPAFFARPPREQIERLFDAWIDLRNWSEFFRIAEIECESQTVPRPSTHHWGADHNDIPTTEALPAARAYVVSVLKRAPRQTLGDWQSLVSLGELVKNENGEFLIPVHKQRGRSSYLYGGREVYQGFWPAGEGRWSSGFERGADWDKVEGRFLRQLLGEPLLWLGIVAIARDGANQIVAFRLSPLGAHLLGLSDALPEEDEGGEGEKPLIIQPNFEIMAYTEAAHLPVLYQLERFAHRERAERVAHYKLDRESVYRGLQDGLSAQEMREFLEEHSRSGLPQNIAYSLDDWQSLWERVTVRASTSVVEAGLEQELDAFLATLPASGATKLAPCWALIEARYLEVARNALESRGARGFDYSIETEQAFTTSNQLEIAVPVANLDLKLRAKLAQFADEMPAVKGKARYRITRASVERAAQSGLKAEAILKFLGETGTPPIPPNVTLSVCGWGGAVKPVALGAMQVLVAAPLVIAQMASIEELRPLLGLGSEGTALIEAADVPKLKAQLKQRGIAFDGEAQAHLKAPQPLAPGPTPRRAKPAQRGVEIGVKRVVKRTLVPAHPDESEVDLQVGLSENEIKDLLATAMEKSRCVVIEYQSKARLALRKINPVELYQSGETNYIGAYDHWRKDGRVFRLDRIVRIAVLDEKFDASRFG